MPMHQSETTVTAASTTESLLSGTHWERMPYNAHIALALVADSNNADLVIDVQSGLDVIADAITPSAADRTPVYPDDYTLTDVIGSGEQLKIRVRNTHASNTPKLRVGLVVTPV